MASAAKLYNDLSDSIIGNQETSFNKLGSESKGIIKAIQKIEGGSLKDIFMKGMPSDYKAGGPVINPTTAMPDAPMSGLANLMAMKGRDNDSMLVHLSPTEVSNLNKLSGNTMTINPATGLPEGRSRFLEAALPALLSIGAGIATGGLSIPAQMAAAAAASGLGAKMTGKSNDEALTSAVLGGATAGLLGGQGSNIAAGGKEAGREIALKAAQDAAALKGSEVIGNQAAIASAEALKKETADQLARATADLAKNEAGKVTGAELRKVASQTDLAPFKDFVASPQNVYGNIVADMQNMSAYDALTQTDNLKGLTGIGVREVGGNALVNQMRDDANRPPPVQEDFSNPIDIYSTPFTQTAMGPFNQQQIADNFISGGTGPYGMNYFNQAYGQEGGQVQEMYEGGLTQFQSIMGNPALQLQNPNPPMQMAFGGALGKALGIGGGSSSASAQGGPRGSSQGGKGSGFFKEMMENPEIVAMLQKGQEQPEQKMAGGGMMGDIPPELLKKLEELSGQSGIDAFKGRDTEAPLSANPVQAMNQGGGLPQVGQGQASIIQALQPMLQVANERAQQPMQMAGGGEIVADLRAIAGNRAFEGRVKGEGDGMSDSIPFNIEGEQPALLARDEYVIPADIVAMVGNGSSDAGADHIDQAIAGIREAKYGRQQQPRETEGLGGLLG